LGHKFKISSNCVVVQSRIHHQQHEWNFYHIPAKRNQTFFSV